MRFEGFLLEREVREGFHFFYFEDFFILPQGKKNAIKYTNICVCVLKERKKERKKKNGL